ncbi:hypothetical protein C6P91_26605 [Burkholderia multivorans]|nr:hypothetical protein C6P91_26605 [Burkholderia multivorans]
MIATRRSAARRCGAVQCGAVRCGAVRCGAVRCGDHRHHGADTHFAAFQHVQCIRLILLNLRVRVYRSS